MSLNEKVAIVTGGSRGLRATIARELASRGANVLITYNSAKGEADKVAQDIVRKGREALMVQCRGDDRAAPVQVVSAAVTKWGRIDIIINNAAFGDDMALTEITHDLWDKTFDTNIRMPAFLIKEAMPHFGSAPRIVNISSTAARAAALEGLTRVLARELGQGYNLTINCVNPGPIATDMWFKHTEPEISEAAEAVKKGTPAAPRIAETDDIAQIVAFLAEEASR
ncbi:hypothetical protein AARAC_001625 [Aspergillus arachidicola]|uniref:SDR family oxidoreductase n=1 Tax=Aspergillus arachidicola TaxID=656916 RepID=A0A2G7FIP5_9EURO|nr:hypothetical protein AARAC_001625 [Aspergillus arachidicola]